MSLVLYYLDNIWYIGGMEAVIPISLKRLAVKNMQAVKRGELSHKEAAHRLKNLSRTDIVTHLTKQYDNETATALRYFKML
ncbi:MAG TPA: hypothetical protein VJ964_00005 [Balneolaceae bacterium]|nr:hypothetical protein [Balneolaceae bacterium]